MNWVKDIFKEKTSAAGNGKINPFRLTKQQNGIMKSLEK